MQSLKARLKALEQRQHGAMGDELRQLSDAALAAEIEAALILLEQGAEQGCAPDELDDQIVEALNQLRLGGGFPLGTFDEARAEKLIKHLLMQGENR